MRPTTASRVPLEKFTRNLKEMIRLVREHGARPLLVTSWGEARRRARMVLRWSALPARTAVPLVVYTGPHIDIVSPSSEGYAQLAAKILNRMEIEGYVSYWGQPDLRVWALGIRVTVTSPGEADTPVHVVPR